LSQTNGDPLTRSYASLNPNHTMSLKRTENRITTASALRTRYQIVNHQEAGLFDSMTVATIWALKNVQGWNWRIEPVAGSCM
jgi:hypothetical protein